MAQRVTISWYKTYTEHSVHGVLSAVDDWGFLSSPTTCPICLSKVIKLLDIYRNTNDFSAIKELSSMACGCKDAWHSTLDASEPLRLPERVARTYEALGQDVLGKKWWDENGSYLREELTS